MNSRLPPWFKQELPAPCAYETAKTISGIGVHTVCQEARCPNINVCFREGTATFLILGKTCTRNCLFCAVDKNWPKTSLALDTQEPLRIKDAVKALSLKFVVITSVTRDDLEDGGASIFAETIKLVRGVDSDIKIEVLIPDFKGTASSLECLVHARPDIIGHNIETVPRLYPCVRPQADFKRSLYLLHRIKEFDPCMITKSSLMLGLGETEEEIMDSMRDLRYSKCDILTLGQYLAPSPEHYPVKELIAPERFLQFKNEGYRLGFRSVVSGPLVRSSYRAKEAYSEVF